MSQALANTHHALCIIDALWRAGVRDAVVSPGSRNTPLVFAFDALQRQGRMRVHVAIDERTAGFIALGMARGSARPVALACTSGSAGAHYAPALAEAQRSGLCVIALTADRPQELQQRGAPQTIDQRRLFEGFVHETLLLDAPDTHDRRHATTQSVLRACVQARGAHQPLHLNVGFREPLWDDTCNALLDAPPAERPLQLFAATPMPSDEALDALAAAARGRGLIYVGPIDPGQRSDADRATLVTAIHEAAQRVGWPVASDAVAPTRVHDTASAPTLQHADILFRSDTLLPGDALDVLVVVGPWPTAKPLGQWLERHPSVRVLSIPGVIGAIDPWHRVDLTVEGDMVAALGAIGRCSKGSNAAPRQPDDFSDTWLAIDAAMDASIRTYCASTLGFEGTIARTVVDAVTGPAVLQIASSMPIRDVDTYSRGAHKDVFLCASRGVNGIDGLVATAFGTATVRDTPGVLLIGDIAFRHDIGGLMHAAQQDVPLTVVVVDNGGGGIFRHLAVAQSGERFDPYFLTPQQNDLARLAAGTGARTQMVDPTALRTALLDALPRQGVDVLIVPVDADAQVPHRKAAVQQALDAAGPLLSSPTDAP